MRKIVSELLNIISNTSNIHTKYNKVITQLGNKLSKNIYLDNGILTFLFLRTVEIIYISVTMIPVTTDIHEVISSGTQVFQ